MEAGFCEGDSDIEDKEGRVALISALADTSAQAACQPSGLKRTQEAASSLMTHQVADVVLCLLSVGCQEGWQLKSDCQLMPLPDCRHQVQPAALHITKFS